MDIITNISVEMGEKCKVDVEILHESLLKLPTEKYLDLFKKMYGKIYGYQPFVNFGGCCGTIEDKSE